VAAVVAVVGGGDTLKVAGGGDTGFVLNGAVG